MRHSRHADFSPGKSVYILLISFRSYQLILATAQKIQQIVQKLTHIGSTGVMRKIQFTNAPSKENPKVLIVEHPKLSPRAVEQSVAVGVESLGMQLRRIVLWQGFAYTLAHFSGGIVGVSKGENLVRFGMAFADQVSNTLNKNRSLACPCPGNDQQWSVDMLDCDLLLLIRNKLSNGIRLLRYSHLR